MKNRGIEHDWAGIYRAFRQKNRAFYPAYHLAPPSGWLNDPNGLIYYNGLYHAFYQYYPYSAQWGDMHWGHAASPDMVHWTHYPPALWPTAGTADKDGCFSGSAVIDGDTLCLIYTGHSWTGEKGKNGLRPFREVQCLATSSDGFNFTKQGVVLTPPEGIDHFRDPKLWFAEGLWRLVLGVSDSRDMGQVYLYRGKTLRDWEFDRVLAVSDGSMGYMWECPDFFPLGDKHVLTFSPQGIQAHRGYRRRNLYQCGYVCGSWQAGQDFVPETPFIELDNGHDYYAAQSFQAADGRRIIMAWLDMWESEQPTEAEGWAGSMTLPRALSLSADGRLRAVPVAELASLRAAEEALPPIILDNTTVKLAENIGAQEIILHWDRKNARAERYGIRLGRSLMIYMDTQIERLVLDRFYPDVHLSGSRSTALQPGDTLILHIFFDYSSVEIFVNEGEAVLTSRIYPAAAERTAFLFADGGKAVMTGGTKWNLQNCLQETDRQAEQTDSAEIPEQSE